MVVALDSGFDHDLACYITLYASILISGPEQTYSVSLGQMLSEIKLVHTFLATPHGLEMNL